MFLSLGSVLRLLSFFVPTGHNCLRHTDELRIFPSIYACSHANPYHGKIVALSDRRSQSKLQDTSIRTHTLNSTFSDYIPGNPSVHGASTAIAIAGLGLVKVGGPSGRAFGFRFAASQLVKNRWIRRRRGGGRGGRRRWRSMRRRG